MAWTGSSEIFEARGPNRFLSGCFLRAVRMLLRWAGEPTDTSLNINSIAKRWKTAASSSTCRCDRNNHQDYKALDSQSFTFCQI
jgi:hypothetical protein